LPYLPGEVKDRALLAMAAALRADAPAILAANARDLAAADARTGAEAMAPAMRRRLSLDPAKIEGMAAALEEVAAQPDPIGAIEDKTRRPDGLEVGRMRVPLGVILMVYEARPNATSDAAGLCLKSGNAVLLRGGHEALQSNLAIAASLERAAAQAGVPDGWLHVVARPDREDVLTLLKMDDLIDLVVPRGGESLLEFVAANARMPVLRHARGVCHVYVDAAADLDMAERITVNSKAQNPAVCNAAEALLVHADVRTAFIPHVVKALLEAKVEIRGDAAFVAADARVIAATEADWGHEFLAPIIAARIVSSFDDALAHIARYGSRHTEAIVTRDLQAASRFQREVDASAVIVNGSTRLNDGGTLGLGAELGISTSKLHAYGPMGVRELTTRKFVVMADGHLRT
jgi:glutamate-5-semialdehyde dehydrogenase